ncbi:Protein arginine N-methyltransferase [Pyrenophora tritici-repentis]|nr:Protein arginine N-methyltransferase [Pyrenophora tritici-repentis]KAI0589785.1 Protein arginine N-methyltransferase [Pyrenophora tritici-repentis]KAI0625531.1 Protein arginine N-methyltransferase [Pyrenophora tritici-repentis]PZD05077.1 protein arginine N-methyltransferase HSL7 [Pyrenophora tritici-repentis]PZD36827.1 protein arginine N-methyltransferase HSL7 [Pyrenophora tritici-repentis]
MDYSEGMDHHASVFYIGQHESKRSLDVSPELVQHAQDLGYDMITSPITNDNFHTRVLGLLNAYTQTLAESQSQPLPLIPALDNLDTPLGPTDTIGQLVTFSSSWIDLSSPDPLIAHLSRQVFHLEVAYAGFCGVTNLVVPGPRLAHGQAGVSQYARSIKEALQTGSYIQIHVQLPMDGRQPSSSEDDLGDLARFARPEFEPSSQAKTLDSWSSWDAWNTIRSICKYHNRLSIMLDLPRRLPSLAIQSRWFSEPVRLLNLLASSFLVNARQSYVLSKAHQVFIFRCFRLQRGPWLLISDTGPLPGIDDPDMIMSYSTGHLSPRTVEDAPSDASSSRAPTPAEAAQLTQKVPKKSSSSNDPTPHLSYMRYLQRNQPTKSQIERFGGGFQDYLQSPLQPLTDNLESITYEVFEKDPIKYAWYERAIAQALKDWHTERRSTSSENGAVVIAVVGSGRGPLVTRALNASASSGVPVKVYAIEKNPNAYVLLKRHNVETWGGRVTVVKTDMRAWKGPVQADGTLGNVDILVSELLGSFADNELSPECLDGVQHVLNPDHGISIPSSYTAHFTPISTPKLWADLYNRSTNIDPNAFDIPWVVMLTQFDYLSAEETQNTIASQQLTNGTKMQNFNLEPPLEPNVQTAWEFTHPLPPSVLAQSSLRKGAYFETVLYSGSEGPVELSTNPVTMEQKSKDMISWFPILFPLKVPMTLPANSEVEVSFWRQTDDRKVWYEWLVESYMVVNGQRIRLGVSDLHSSKSNGCMM